MLQGIKVMMFGMAHKRATIYSIRKKSATKTLTVGETVGLSECRCIEQQAKHMRRVSKVCIKIMLLLRLTKCDAHLRGSYVEIL